MARLPKSAVPRHWITGARSRGNSRPLVVFACEQTDAGYRLTLPIELPSLANLREHWASKAKRAKQQRARARDEVTFLTQRFFHNPNYHSWRVTLTRIGPKPLDVDNLVGAFKAVRDGVADALGYADDSDSRLEWRYAQEQRGKLYGCVIELERT